MKLATYYTLIAATAAVPGPLIAAGSVDLSPLQESRKLVRVNRVDRVSTNADWIRIEWPTGTLSTSATLAPALRPIDAPTNDVSSPESEPAAVASSTRVELRPPTLDVRSVGKRNRPS
jgi:hypothetical protein